MPTPDTRTTPTTNTTARLPWRRLLAFCAVLTLAGTVLLQAAGRFVGFPSLVVVDLMMLTGLLLMASGGRRRIPSRAGVIRGVLAAVQPPPRSMAGRGQRPRRRPGVVPDLPGHLDRVAAGDPARGAHRPVPGRRRARRAAPCHRHRAGRGGGRGAVRDRGRRPGPAGGAAARPRAGRWGPARRPCGPVLRPGTAERRPGAGHDRRHQHRPADRADLPGPGARGGTEGRTRDDRPDHVRRARRQLPVPRRHLPRRGHAGGRLPPAAPAQRGGGRRAVRVSPRSGPSPRRPAGAAGPGRCTARTAAPACPRASAPARAPTSPPSAPR